MAESSVKTIIYKCPYVKKKVALDVKYTWGEKKTLLGGQQIEAQELKKCDLQSMQGCNLRIDTFDSKCPAVALAAKCTLK